MKLRVASMPPSQREREISQITRRLELLSVFRRSRTVALYMSLPHEVDTGPIVRICRRLKKQIVVPVIDVTQSGMRFAVWAGKPARNRYGILEPRASKAIWVPPEKIDIVIIPGRAFTPDCRRLGSGGGYYDRFLEKHPSLTTIGLAHSVQIVQKVPVCRFDQRLDMVLTSVAVYR
jgi:5-formyltetrahydrofolate cyclo-ligase